MLVGISAWANDTAKIYWSLPDYSSH